jgi:isoamylase
LSWLDWTAADTSMLAFVQRVIALRREQPVLRRKRFFSGEATRQSGRKDLAWLLPNGSELSDAAWENAGERSLGMILNGNEIPDRDARGEGVVGDSLMLLLHSGDVPITWTMPAGWDEGWTPVLDTSHELGDGAPGVFRAGQEIAMEAHSMIVLRHPPGDRSEED